MKNIVKQTLSLETTKFFLKLHIPVMVMLIYLLTIIEIDKIVFISFLITYILSYWLGYNIFHRAFAHKQFTLNKFGKYIFGYFGLFCMLGDAITYSLAHRYHHRYSDTEKDLHSPIHGKFHSFIGWFFKPNKIGQYQILIKDLLHTEYKILFFYKKYQLQIIYFTLFLISLISFKILLGILICMVTTFILEMLSNSFFNHTTTSAKNNLFYSWLSLSSYHYLHHKNPMLVAKTDPSYFLIKFLKLIKVAK
jgi:stearoyl-CoA desaturase (delta-9 desaturase)